MSNAMDVIVFEVGGRRLALDLSRVQEVFTLGYVTALPVVSDAIRGATNLRGRMVPVISLEPLFGLSVGSWVRPGAPAILISTDEATAAIPVQRILDVISFGDERVKAVEILAPVIVDKENSHTVLKHLDFDDEKAKVRALLE